MYNRAPAVLSVLSTRIFSCLGRLGYERPRTQGCVVDTSAPPSLPPSLPPCQLNREMATQNLHNRELQRTASAHHRCATWLISRPLHGIPFTILKNRTCSGHSPTVVPVHPIPPTLATTGGRAGGQTHHTAPQHPTTTPTPRLTSPRPAASRPS